MDALNRQGQTVISPMLRWMGGKSKLSKQIISIFPKHTCYVEPFCGGAAIFLRKPRSKSEVINDADGELINLYRCVKYHPDELSKQSIGLLHSRWLFNHLKQQSPLFLTDIQRAARFYALNRMAFGGGMKNPSFGYTRSSAAGLSVDRFKRDIEIISARLDKAFIEQLDWVDCVQRYDSVNTLIYCDPPYYQSTDYGVDFGFEQYVKMAHLAKTIQGKMVISLNDKPEIRDVFNGLKMERLSIKYSRGLAQVGGTRKESFELLIRNF